MSEIFPAGDGQYSQNLGLALWGADEVVIENFLLIDAAFGSVGGSVNVNGVAVPAPANFINSATVTFSVVGSNISLTASGSSGTFPVTFPAVAHEWLNSYSSVTGLFTATQPSAADLSNGTDGTGAVVLASAISGFGDGTVTSVSFTGGLISVANPTTTPSLTVAGTSGGVPYFSSASTWASSGVLPAGDFVLGGGAGSAPTASFSIVPIANGGTGAATVAAGTVFGNPTGSTAAPSFTSVPVLGINASVAGTLGIANGGALGTTITIQNLGNTTAYNFNLPTTAGTAGQVLTSQAGASTSMTWTTPTTGTVTSVSFTGGLISVATATTTPALTVAGTSGGIPYFSSASTWASSAVLPAGDFVLGGGAGSAPTASFSIVPIANGGTGAATVTGGTVFGNPTGSTAAPSFTAAPVLGINTTTSGTLGLATSVASGATITIENGGATTAYNFILPTTVGSAGQVLTSQAGGSTAMTWTTPTTGTVTSFSAGNLSPLFTTSVATSTTTPALSFSLSNAGGGTVFGNNTTSSGAPAYTTAPVLGIPGTSTGTIALASSTASGKYTITAPANAATPTLTLPTTSNVLTGQFAGDGTVLSSTLATASAAGTVTASLANASAGTVLGNATGSSTTPTYTSTPVLGLPGTSTGTIALASSTASGKFTITAPASSATPTLTLPTTTNVLAGQFAGDGTVLSSTLATASAAGTITAALASAASGTFLGNITNSSAAPTYAALSAVKPETTTYQVLAADFSAYKTITVASGTFTITLVASGSQPANGQYINVINYGSGVVTIARSGQNINGGTTSLTLGAGSATAPTSATVISDGTNYFAEVNTDVSGTVTSVSFTGGLISVATATTTPALTVAGTSGGIPYFSSASTWASSAALPAGDFVLGGGAGAAPTATFSIVPIANGGTGAATVTAGTVFGNPSGSTAAPSFTSAPVLGINATTAGTLGLANGGTSGTTITIQNLGNTTAYNFNLPTTAGASGSVLTSAGGSSSSMTWTTQAALGVAWSSLTNATGNLSLSNGTDTTTFNQTSNVAWLWANTTTATSGTTNASPLLELAANYWTGSASAADTWTIGSSLAAGTNGTSLLTIAHSGSSGASPAVVFPGGAFGTPSITFTGATGVGYYLSTGNSSGVNGIGVCLSGTGVAVFETGNLNFQSVIGIGWSSSTNPEVAADTNICRVAAGILGIGSGTSGSTVGGLRCNSIALNGAVASPTAGVYYSGTAAGVTQTAEAVGTLATTGGIVTTFTAVSDERLKIFTEYEGGLAEVLAINPIRYRWNEKGQELSGQKGDRDYIGFSANNVQKSIPESIQSYKGEERYLSFDDRPVIAALVNAVKTLAARVEALEKRV